MSVFTGTATIAAADDVLHLTDVVLHIRTHDSGQPSWDGSAVIASGQPDLNGLFAELHTEITLDTGAVGTVIVHALESAGGQHRVEINGVGPFPA